MGGKHPGLVGQRQQLAVQGPVQLAGELVGADADRGQQIGTAHVADEQGVPRQHAVGDGVVGVLEDHHADRLGRVPGRGPHLEGDLTQGDPLAIGQQLDRELGPTGRSLAVADCGAGGFGQLEVAGQEVGVEVGLDHLLDPQPVGRGVGEVLGDIPLGVDDHRRTGRWVSHQVGGVGQASEVVLPEEHECHIIPLGVLGSSTP